MCTLQTEDMWHYDFDWRFAAKGNGISVRLAREGNFSGAEMRELGRRGELDMVIFVDGSDGGGGNHEESLSRLHAEFTGDETRDFVAWFFVLKC